MLHIACHGFNVWCGVARLVIIDDLITGEEKQGITVFRECIDGRENALKIGRIVGRARVGAVERVFRRVHVQSQVDPSLREHVHTCVVV